MVLFMTVPMSMLALLDVQSAHGFALKHRYDSLLGQQRELKYGQVYSTLARLERDGLARGVGLEQGEGSDRKVYAVTERGVSEFEEWLTAPHLPSGRPAELFTKVILALVSGRPADVVLDGQRRVYLDRMRQLTAARGTADLVDRLVGDYEIAHLQADLEWIELAGGRLSELASQLRTRGQSEFPQ